MVLTGMIKRKDYDPIKTAAARKLQKDNTETLVLLGKVEQQKAELQKRVDAALARASQACIGNEMFHKQFDDVIRILRGEQALKGESSD